MAAPRGQSVGLLGVVGTGAEAAVVRRGRGVDELDVADGEDIVHGGGGGICSGGGDGGGVV